MATDREGEIDRYVETIDADHLEGVAQRIARRIPAMAEARARGGWAGFYDMTPDEKCIAGPSPSMACTSAPGTAGPGSRSRPRSRVVPQRADL